MLKAQQKNLKLKKFKKFKKLSINKNLKKFKKLKKIKKLIFKFKKIPKNLSIVSPLTSQKLIKSNFFSILNDKFQLISQNDNKNLILFFKH